ncbi:MAG: aromatic ring-hydroxylating dioxygenase subunit alpha [Actinomycetota bacterium]
MSHVRRAWYLAMWSSEVAQAPVRRTICGEQIAFYRGSDGAVRALGAACPHRGADLAEGTIVGNSLQCPFHGWRFDATGACVQIPSQPADLAIPRSACVDAFPIAEQQGAVWVWPSTTHAPDEPAPHIPILDRTNTLLTSPSEVLDAEFVNVVENAFDESNLYFLHTSTIGVSTPLVPRQLVSVSDDRREVTCRWDPDSPWGTELFDGYDAPSGTLDRWLRRRYGSPVHAERRWHYRMGGVVWYHEPLDSGAVVGVVGAATPLDERRTWFTTALIHPVVASRVPTTAVRLWGRQLNREDKLGTVGLLTSASEMDTPVSVVADRGPNQFRRIHVEWLEREQIESTSQLRVDTPAPWRS